MLGLQLLKAFSSLKNRLKWSRGRFIKSLILPGGGKGVCFKAVTISTIPYIGNAIVQYYFYINVFIFMYFHVFLCKL